MKRKVFISFASRDRKVASSICDALEARGHTGWMSSRDVLPGENYQGAIVRAIRDAGVMVLIFSANANNSDEIKKELAVASQQKLMVIPVRAEDVVPSEDYIYELATRQWIDLFDDWEHALDRLARQIDAVIPRGAETDPPPPMQPPRTQAAAVPRKEPVADTGAKRSAGYWIMGSAAALLLLGAGAWALYSRESANTPAPAQVAQSVPKPSPAEIAPAQQPPAPTPPVEAPRKPAKPANGPNPAVQRRNPPARDAAAATAESKLATLPKPDLAQAGKKIVEEIDRLPNIVLRFRVQASGKEVTGIRTYSNVRFDPPTCAILFHDKNDLTGSPTSEREISVDLHNIPAVETYSATQNPVSAKLTILQDVWFLYIPARGAKFSTPASLGMSFPDQATASRMGELVVAASALCGKT